MRALLALFFGLSISFAALANDVGQQPILVDGWYGDELGNGVLLQEASILRDDNFVPIVVALGFFVSPSADEQLVYISQPVDHFDFTGFVDTEFRKIPTGEMTAGTIIADVELQPSPTAFSAIVVGLMIEIEGVGRFDLVRLP